MTVAVERDDGAAAESGDGAAAESETATAPEPEHASENTGYSPSAVTRSGRSDAVRRALTQILALARREYGIVHRARWVLGLAVLFGVLSAAVVALGASSVGPARVPSVVASLTQLSAYLVPLAGLAVGFDSIVGADERGSLETVLALPVSPARIVVGTFLGRAGALAAGTLLGFGFGGAAMVGVAGVGALVPYVRFTLAAVGVGTAFLAVGVFASSLAGAETHALGGSLLAWVWFVLLHDLVGLALVAGLALPEAAVSAIVLANPVDAFRVLVLVGLPTSGGGLAAVLTGTGLSTGLLVAALVAWACGPVLAAARVVGRRRV